MQPENTMENVLHALKALYHSPDASEKERASKWLEDFQKSVDAWTIADQLLSHHQDLESSYFAAHTMRTKIQHHFYELPPGSHTALRDSLLNHIAACDNKTTAAVVTQLSLALADLALLMAMWRSAVPDLLAKFAPKPSSYPVLLEVLTVMPEEISSRHLRLGKNRRTELTELLSESFEGVHQFLLACLSSFHSDQQLASKLFKCLGSWFSIGAVPDEKIRRSQLLEAVFHYLSDTNSQSQLHEAATDCLCAALYKCEDTENYSFLGQFLFERIIVLHNTYVQCASLSDTDRCLNFARIFTEMAESFTAALVGVPNEALGSFSQLELLCSTLENESYEVAEISFNFWYNLSDQLYQTDNPSLNAHFSPYVQRVILSLSKHVQLDADHEGVLDRSDDFYDFRLRARDLIKDIVFIVSSAKLLRELSIQLTPTLPWNESESHLFVIAAVAGTVGPKEDTIIPQLVNTILCDYCNPPTKKHLALAFTCVALLGELKEWIQAHIDILDAVLQLLLLCLRNRKLANMAASALDHICVQCASERKMVDNFPTMLQVVREVDSFHITNEATVKLIKAAAVILSKFPAEQLIEGIRELCSYQVLPLKQLVLENKSVSRAHRTTRQDPGFWLDRLTSVIRYGVPPIENGHHPCYQVMAELWATFDEVCNRYQSDVKIIEKCCRCIRFVIRKLGASFTPLLQALVTLMVSLYSVHLHSCYLYLGAILVDEFGTNPSCVKGLLHMTEALAMPTFELLSKPNGLVNHTDTIDDFFRLCLRFIQKDRLMITGSSITTPMFKCAIASASLQHREANASVMRFLVELFNTPSGSGMNEQQTVAHNQVTALLYADGAELVETLLQCCVTTLPVMMMVDVADVFLSLLRFDRQSVSTWLQASLQKLPTESTGGVVTATPEQLKDFHIHISSATHETEITPVLREFLVLYR